MKPTRVSACVFFFFQAGDGIRVYKVTGVQTCALPISDVMTGGEFFGEVKSIAGRWIKKTLRRPPFLFFSLVQPIVWFVLFTAAFASVADIPGFKESTDRKSVV